jgi:hypothetical protein
MGDSAQTEKTMATAPAPALGQAVVILSPSGGSGTSASNLIAGDPLAKDVLKYNNIALPVLLEAKYTIAHIVATGNCVVFVLNPPLEHVEPAPKATKKNVRSKNR